MRRFLIILLALISVGVALADRTQHNIKKEQQRTNKEIKETAKKIATTQKKTREQVNLLNKLTIEIKENSSTLEKLKQSIDSIDNSMSKLSDSISILEKNLTSLRTKYTNVLRAIRATQHSTNSAAFIFSSKSFSEAYRRIRYMRQFTTWQTRKSKEITTTITSLNSAKDRLIALHNEKMISVKEVSSVQQTLQNNEKKQERIIADLNKEEKSLKAYMEKKRKEAKALDAELDRLIAEERKRQEAERKRKLEEQKRKEQEQALALKNKKEQQKQDSNKSSTEPKKTKSPEAIITPEIDRKLSGSFESNKGRLPYPVTGKCRVVGKFGRHQHPELKYIETDNSGIDIELLSAGSARAIFDGTVSAIFKQPGYNNIVMIRHGEYLSIYANLIGLQVKPGDKVKAHQILGNIYSDPDDDNRCIMHFEIRKETQKLNPQLWIK